MSSDSESSDSEVMPPKGFFESAPDDERSTRSGSVDRAGERPSRRSKLLDQMLGADHPVFSTLQKQLDDENSTDSEEERYLKEMSEQDKEELTQDVADSDDYEEDESDSVEGDDAEEEEADNDDFSDEPAEGFFHVPQTQDPQSSSSFKYEPFRSVLPSVATNEDENPAPIVLVPIKSSVENDAWVPNDPTSSDHTGSDAKPLVLVPDVDHMNDSAVVPLTQRPSLSLPSITMATDKKSSDSSSSVVSLHRSSVASERQSSETPAAVKVANMRAGIANWLKYINTIRQLECVLAHHVLHMRQEYTPSSEVGRYIATLHLLAKHPNGQKEFGINDWVPVASDQLLAIFGHLLPHLKRGLPELLDEVKGVWLQSVMRALEEQPGDAGYAAVGGIMKDLSKMSQRLMSLHQRKFHMDTQPDDDDDEVPNRKRGRED